MELTACSRKGFLAFKSSVKTHQEWSNWDISWGAVLYFVRGGSSFWVYGHDDSFGVIHKKVRLVVSSGHFSEHTRWLKTLTISMKFFKKRSHSNESYWALLPCGMILWQARWLEFWVLLGWNPNFHYQNEIEWVKCCLTMLSVWLLNRKRNFCPGRSQQVPRYNAWTTRNFVCWLNYSAFALRAKRWFIDIGHGILAI